MIIVLLAVFASAAIAGLVGLICWALLESAAGAEFEGWDSGRGDITDALYGEVVRRADRLAAS